MADRGILFSDGERKRKNDKAFRERNKERINAADRDRYAADLEGSRRRAKAYREANYDRVLEYNRRWSVAYRAKLRAEMIAEYGGACACCGEKEPLFLQLDHRENDGHLDRLLHRTSTKLIAFLKRNGWPKDRHQLLCANCNFGKLLNGGICPHGR